MKVEIRSDGLHINGYVNVPGRESRPVITPHGKVIEIIEQRAFQKALEKTSNMKMRLDHEREIASVADGTLKVYEDEVGLRAESIITDEEVIEGAKQGRLKGWSFNMKNIKDDVEERTEGLPVRRVKEFDMNEVSLIMNKTPVYSSTSIEVRADGEDEVETRASSSKFEITKSVETPKESYYEELRGEIKAE